MRLYFFFAGLIIGRALFLVLRWQAIRRENRAWLAGIQQPYQKGFQEEQTILSMLLGKIGSHCVADDKR